MIRVRFAATFPMSKQGHFRAKATDIDRVLPAISKWPVQKIRDFCYTDLDGNMARLKTSEFARFDPYPMPMPVDREGYAKEENSDRYWASGLADWINVESAIDRYLNPKQPVQLLDFGCASGRFLRHALTQLKSPESQVWGCDLAPANINWIRRYLPSEINCVTNSSFPRLPFPDDSFDVVTAFSVFTHIDENEIAWLEELKRITARGGLLYLTIHNDATWLKIPNRPGTIRQFENQNQFEENLRTEPAMFERPIPKPRMVFRKDREVVYNCNVWHSNEYIRSRWGKLFEILRIADCAHASFQTPVIMRVRN